MYSVAELRGRSMARVLGHCRSDGCGGRNMSEAASEGVVRAATRRSRRPSAIWLLPVVAVAIGAWLAWDTLSKEGPTITITFETAEGLQAGQSQLKFREIALGTV